MNGSEMVTAVVSVTASASMAAGGGGDILRIVEEVQTREIEKEIAIAGKKDNFIEVEDERHALWSKPTVSIQAG